MKRKENNYAYIDGANLYRGVFDMGWILDYSRFRIWLKERYGVSRAYIFIGLVQKYTDLYAMLQESGFTLIFKETIYDQNGKPKGNCDADLVLHVVRDVFEGKNDKSLIVSSDGDYASTIKFLKEKKKILVVLSPHPKNKCSILLKRTNVPITYLSDFRQLLGPTKEKAPDGDGTSQGSFS
ncbi:MAG: hypothetical protein A3B11_02055 [Candidatus Taylorbacteria bacterium RIFCSPLOWO2_01_FULL_44_26]|uniref:NYN domain-containing protein n=2 Tax=Candidatus Tayloriibacteriota TaxID=1817919 RepID=A0A1G2MK00_9BACT|nr:MAG: hypothetical protein A3D50_01305 [Candidatus Taylorbacteria bacterium RIFCSPHIGHO2_02_FULL_44_12]OHA30753.1 MAG: hypothetical protein A3B11_02055 [Candidatus Taylorbacteria bacterium RIFCSPLOWO2_01_FULL_44_26]